MRRLGALAKFFLPLVVIFCLFSVIASLQFAIVMGISFWCAVLLPQIVQCVVAMLNGLRVVGYWIGPWELGFSSGRMRVYQKRQPPSPLYVSVDGSELSLEQQVVATRRMAVAGPLTSVVLAVWAFWLPGINLTTFFFANES